MMEKSCIQINARSRHYRNRVQYTLNYSICMLSCSLYCSHTLRESEGTGRPLVNYSTFKGTLGHLTFVTSRFSFDCKRAVSLPLPAPINSIAKRLFEYIVAGRAVHRLRGARLQSLKGGPYI